jgi:hypothetical protein
MQNMPHFYENKTFVEIKQGKELWTYAHPYPNLILKDQTVFGIKAKRDFYSPHKQEIFKELGLIENEKGIFPLSLYNTGSLLNVTPVLPYFRLTGFVQLGDLIDLKPLTGEGQVAKLSRFKGVYDEKTNLFLGSFAF